jgi:hypothetical protein
MVTTYQAGWEVAGKKLFLKLISCEITWNLCPYSLAAVHKRHRRRTTTLCKSDEEKERVEKKQAGGVFFCGHPLSARSASGG